MYPFKPYVPRTGFSELVRALMVIAIGALLLNAGIQAGVQIDRSHFMLGWGAPGLVVIGTGLGILVQSIQLFAKRQ